jgi:PAS domain S-box-containing protein
MSKESPSVIWNERENFRNLFKQTPEMVCIMTGPDHVFEFVNEAHVKVLGFDATGMPVRVAQPESVEVHGILDDVYRTGVTAHLHEIPVTVTNRLRYFNLTYAARRDNSGNINGIMILGIEVSTEIESREALRESREKLSYALASAKMGVWTVDIKNNSANMSQEALNIFGIDNAGDIANIINKVIHPEDREKAFSDLGKAISDGGEYYSEYRITDRDGKIKWILAQGQVTKDAEGNPVTLAGIIMDITERKAAEVSLQQTIKARDEFLSIASHELKTPLTSLKLQMEIQKRLLKRNDGSAFTESNIQSLITMINKQVNRFNRLVDDMLDVSRIQTGNLPLHKKKFEICDLIKETLSRLEPMFTAEGYEQPEFNHCSPVEGIWDRLRIEQVIVNLLTNAIRYGNKKPISVVVTSTPVRVLIAVKDHGHGIAEENQEIIFGRFERAISANEVSGLGLGLFISKQIVLGHQGKIWVESALGKGSTFFIELPL